MSKTVAVVGAGIAGLATAYFLEEGTEGSGDPVQVTLIEADRRLGGQVESENAERCVIEGGPDSFFTPKPQAVDLCVKLGLSDLLIGTNPAMKNVYVYCGGKLRKLPDGLTSVVPSKLRPFLSTDLITPLGKARMLLDLFKSRRRDEGDESLAHFVRRRLGNQALQRIAEPLMAGIYSGDADKLSMETNFPQLLQLEKEHRSLILGTIANRRRAAAAPKNPNRRPTFMALRGGMGVMTDTLASKLKSALILTGKKAVTLKASPAGEGRYEVVLEDGTSVHADAVVLATPAYASAEIIGGLSPAAASVLGSIPYVSAATVGLIYDRAGFPHPLDGTGLIVAPSEGRRITACTWVSSKWPQHSPPDRVVLRCYLGRDGSEEILKKSDDELCQIAQDEVNLILDISAEPMVKRIHRCDKSMPQYYRGHLERLAALDEAMRNLPGVFLTGSAYRGVGLADCVKQAASTANDTISFLRKVES